MTKDDENTVGLAIFIAVIFIALGIGGVFGWPYGCFSIGITFALAAFCWVKWP